MSLAFAAALGSMVPATALAAPPAKEKAAEIEVELAHAEIAAGKLIAASKRLTTLATADDGTPAGKKARESAKKELGDLMMKIPALKIAVRGPAAGAKIVVKIDGAEASAGSDESVDPGEHTVSVSADGFKPSEQKVTVGEGARQAVEIALEPGSSAAAADQGGLGPRWPGIVVAGAGGLTLIVGAIVGGAALGATSSARSAPGCVNSVCPDTPEVNDKIQKAKTLGNASTGLFIGGGVVTVAGAVLFFVLPGMKKSEPARAGRVVPWFSGDQAGIAGVF